MKNHALTDWWNSLSTADRVYLRNHGFGDQMSYQLRSGIRGAGYDMVEKLLRLSREIGRPLATEDIRADVNWALFSDCRRGAHE